MKKSIFLAMAVLVLGISAPVAAGDLKLVPEPKQVKTGEGQFAITAQTRIVIHPAHAGEDSSPAEMLARQIQGASGQPARITRSRRLPTRAGTIYIARAGDHPELIPELAKMGLGIDAQFDRQGYVLLIDSRRIIVSALSGQGLFYGVQTLKQLISYDRRTIPALAIKDWPSMQWRGVHDDISRGPVPTLDYMKKQIRTCAAFKLNLFALYIEHVFDYRANPLVGPKEGSLTAADVRELVAYAAKFYVTILPEQQAFGHLHHILKYEIYSDLAETPHGHVLAPANDKSYELISSLYSELVPLFPGPFFHIGADETFELGRGQTKSLADRIGLGRVYLEHLKRVAGIMRPYEKRLMFWGDIAMRYPELLQILPKDCIAVAWAYGPSSSFEAMLKPYKDAGLDIFVAPGANNWNRIFPNLDAAFINIKNFVRDGHKYGALGMLNTTWDDDGEALFGMTWPAVVFGAACAWQPGESSIEQFKSKYDWVFYRNQDRTFEDAIQNLSRAHSILGSAGFEGPYDDFFWLDPFSEYGSARTARALPAAHDLRLAAERALAALLVRAESVREQQDTVEYLVFAAERLDALGMKIQFASEISKFYWDAYLNMSDRARVSRDLDEITQMNGRLEDLRDSITRLKTHYSSLWLKENRPYWLGNVLVRYDNLASLYQSKIQAVAVAQAQYRERSVLPTPQQMGFFVR
jgi:hexosaminidase